MIGSTVLRAHEASDRIDGVWRRVGRQISGEGGAATRCQLVEPSDVAWAQVGTRFADVRSLYPGRSTGRSTGGRAAYLLDVDQAFSGRFERRGARAIWHHDLDSHPQRRRSGARDEALLEAGPRAPGPLPGPEETSPAALDRLVERGEGYVEHWELHPASAGPTFVAERYLEGPVLEGPVLEGPVLGDPVLEARLVVSGQLGIAVWCPASHGIAGDPMRAPARCVPGSGLARWSAARPGGALYDGRHGWNATTIVGDLAFALRLADCVRALVGAERLPAGWREVDPASD